MALPEVAAAPPPPKDDPWGWQLRRLPWHPAVSHPETLSVCCPLSPVSPPANKVFKLVPQVCFSAPKLEARRVELIYLGLLWFPEEERKVGGWIHFLQFPEVLPCLPLQKHTMRLWRCAGLPRGGLYTKQRTFGRKVGFWGSS